MKTTYYILNKSDGTTGRKRLAYDVSIFMLGRRIDNYILIKEDDRGARVITITSPECTQIERDLENG